jgi:hypothetical protein
MDSQFTDWIALTDEYAQRLSNIAPDQADGWAGLRQLAERIRSFSLVLGDDALVTSLPL